jgi:hypothetical protein
MMMMMMMMMTSSLLQSYRSCTNNESSNYYFFEGKHPVVYGQLFTILCRHYTTHKNSCIVTTCYIWLHVSAVSRPSSGQQIIALLRHIQLVFLVELVECTLKHYSLLA